MRWVSRLFGGQSKTPIRPTAELIREAIANRAPMPRRLLLMLRELHRMGHERLRAVTGLSHSGCDWRLQITPAIGVALPGKNVDFIARENRGVAVGDWVVYAGENFVCYSTCWISAEHADQCFGWTDAADDSPCQLAAKFVKRFPAVVEDGKGSDPDYARWYADMIEATEPEGLIYMYADWELPSDHIPVLNMDGMRVPPPPRITTSDAQGLAE